MGSNPIRVTPHKTLMAYDYSIKRGSRKSGNFSKLVIIIVILLIIGFKIKSTVSKSDIQSPIPNENTQSEIKADSLSQVSSEIKKITSGKPGTYSVLISNLRTGEQTGINENTIFTAASVNKVPTLAVLYNLVDKGKIDLDKTITLQAKDIQDYGTGSIRYDKPGTVYSIKTLARLMMEKSDNTAYYLLTNQLIGVAATQNQINLWGLTQTDINLNKTSNTDQEKLFRLMYEGKIANPALTSEMFDFMNDSDFEDRIPALLPQNIPVYHKIGNEVRNTHDVGIVEPFNGDPYYIGVFTSDNPDEQDAIKVIADISKIVYNYYSR